MIEHRSPEQKLAAAGATVVRLDGRIADPKSKVRAQDFVRTNTNTLMATIFPPIRWVVPGYVSEGLALLAGRQKLGKTWLAIDWAVAVASGGYAMGSIACAKGDVLYIDLENGPRRIQRRLRTIFPDDRNFPDLSRLEWVEQAPQLNDGFIERLDKWRASVSEPRLVIIDVLQRIKPTGNAKQNAYESDYSIMAALQQWATRYGIAVVALHHTKKGGADDPLEAVSGSNGLSACADTTLVLDRDANGVTLYVRGRDVEELESSLKFTRGLWTLTGEASETRRTDERARILSALVDADEAMSAPDLASATEMSRNNVHQLLYKMAKAGEVRKAARGRYIHPDRIDLDLLSEGQGKNDKKIRNSAGTHTEQELKPGARSYWGSSEVSDDKKVSTASEEPCALENREKKPP